jgi:hypothetical protein
VSTLPRTVRIGLLEIEPDLRAGLDPEALQEVARRALATAVPLAAGPWAPPAPAAGAEPPIGLLLGSGLLIREVAIGGRVAAQLSGPGDLIDPWTAPGDALRADAGWTVCESGNAALVDERLLRTLSPWPQVVANLLGRVVRQEGRTAVLHAISGLPRVEDRLLALLWHLADRWGRVGPTGVVVPLGLTHATLGRLAGAARPTVSLALQALAADGLVDRRQDGAWALDPAGRARVEGRPKDGAPAPRRVTRVELVPAATGVPVLGSAPLRTRLDAAVARARTTQEDARVLCERIDGELGVVRARQDAIARTRLAG